MSNADTHAPGSPDYGRRESRAHQLDRNWAELVQELRVIGTGIQILFAFLLSIAFQARFGQTTTFEKDVYLGTMLSATMAAGLFIAPVALHRFLFRFRVKDEVVALTNRLAIGGLVALSTAMVGAVLLVSDWVAGTAFGWVAGAATALLLGGGWFAVPAVLRHDARSGLSVEALDDDEERADDAGAKSPYVKSEG